MKRHHNEATSASEHLAWDYNVYDVTYALIMSHDDCYNKMISSCVTMLIVFSI